jgi:RNA polymerase sigma-70 factor (ECF subfamily)
MAGASGSEFETCWIHTAGKMRAYMFCVCENWADADDLVQECYLRALKGWDRFDGQGTRQSWLFQIARRTCSDWLRQKKRKDVLTCSDQASRVTEPAFDRQSTDEIEAVWSAIASLKAEQSEVIHLRFAAGLSYAQIAKVLRIPVGTVRSRLHRGLTIVREQMREDENGT